MIDQISYNDLRKETTALANRKKKSFYHEQIDAASDNQKALYTTLKHLSGLKEPPTYPCNRTDEKLANDFAEFYISKVMYHLLSAQ